MPQSGQTMDSFFPLLVLCAPVLSYAIYASYMKISVSHVRGPAEGSFLYGGTHYFDMTFRVDSVFFKEISLS